MGSRAIKTVVRDQGLWWEQNESLLAEDCPVPTNGP